MFGENIRIQKYLDPYHLNKYITRTFTKKTPFAKEVRKRCFAFLEGGKPDATLDFLEEVLKADKKALANHVNIQALKELMRYIKHNREWIVDTRGKTSMGTIESDHMRIAKARMTARPCGWSGAGAHALAHLSSYKHSGIPIPLCSKEKSSVVAEQIEVIENDGTKAAIVKTRLTTDTLKWTNTSEYVYGLKGSLVAAPARISYAAHPYGRHNVGYY